MHFIDLDIPIFNYLTTLSNVFFFYYKSIVLFHYYYFKVIGHFPK